MTIYAFLLTVLAFHAAHCYLQPDPSNLEDNNDILVMRNSKVHRSNLRHHGLDKVKPEKQLKPTEDEYIEANTIVKIYDACREKMSRLYNLITDPSVDALTLLDRCVADSMAIITDVYRKKQAKLVKPVDVEKRALSNNAVRSKKGLMLDAEETDFLTGENGEVSDRKFDDLTKLEVKGTRDESPALVDNNNKNPGNVARVDKTEFLNEAEQNKFITKKVARMLKLGKVAAEQERAIRDLAYEQMNVPGLGNTPLQSGSGLGNIASKKKSFLAKLDKHHILKRDKPL